MRSFNLEERVQAPCTLPYVMQMDTQGKLTHERVRRNDAVFPRLLLLLQLLLLFSKQKLKRLQHFPRFVFTQEMSLCSLSLSCQ